MAVKIKTTIALLKTLSAYINSKTVLLKTDSWDITTTTDNIKTDIHNLMIADNYYYITPL